MPCFGTTWWCKFLKMIVTGITTNPTTCLKMGHAKIMYLYWHTCKWKIKHNFICISIRPSVLGWTCRVGKGVQIVSFVLGSALVGELGGGVIIHLGGHWLIDDYTFWIVQLLLNEFKKKTGLAGSTISKAWLHLHKYLFRKIRLFIQGVKLTKNSSSYMLM